ncbi:lipopolysaccharide biosynthesis protein [[Leptolyngbya] sp. PCC 7376]|uniref:GumC family protein n=1 Tax=[Leptolyngbya] sp. PCC 7376 TaxID=111781 RepID=UPI00029F4C62|nr:tyrosine-protein kinase domain-containing protein [[Leptolyngbya] sp. PCC 7376]AFY37965.1 lipopolysaccharide biosynthesis protein [[Leptolyngbya] sp. PCC 7376]
MRHSSSSKRHLPTVEAKTVERFSMTAPQQTPNQPNAEDEESGGNKVGEIIEMVQRRALIIMGVAIVMIGNSAIKLSKVPTTYRGNFQLLVEPVNAELASLSNPGATSSALDYDTQLAILRSPALLLPIIEDLRETYPSLGFGRLLGGLEIEQLGKTKIIEVSFASTNQALTRAVLDDLSTSYLEYSKEKRQTFLQQGLRFVDEQRRITQEKVDELQKQLQEFRQKNGFARPEDRSNQLTAQLGSLEAERLEIEQELAILEVSLRNIQTEEGIQALLINDGAYQDIRAQIREVDTQLGLERTRFQEGNSVIQALKQRRDTLLPVLQQQVNATVEAKLAEGSAQIRLYNTRLQNIDAARTRISEEIQNLSALIREYNNIERQLGIAVGSLTNFLQSRQALQIEAAQSEIPWELVREPSAFAQPNDFMKALQNKIVVGIVAGLAVAFALDKLDGSFHTISALQRKVKPPILGVLPFNQQVFLSQENSGKAKKRKRKFLNRVKQLMIRLSQRFSSSASKLAIALFEEYDGTVEFFESLRVIHTNIMPLIEERNYKTFVVSAATVGDGKTTVAINWADTAAVMGQKVLLIDANFRKPEIPEFLNLDNDAGLVDLLREPTQDITSYVKKVFEDRELFVLSPGKSEDEIAKLLNNERLDSVMAKLEQEFDLIILDIPSMLGLADATLFSRNTDALILVTSLHKTRQTILQETLDELENKQIPVLGLVVNRQKGAAPVLRATLSQSSNTNYFPDLENNSDIPPTIEQSLASLEVEDSENLEGVPDYEHGIGEHTNDDGEVLQQLPVAENNEKEESII